MIPRIYLQVISLRLWAGKVQLMVTCIAFPRGEGHLTVTVQASLIYLPHHAKYEDDGMSALSLLQVVQTQACKLGLHADVASCPWT